MPATTLLASSEHTAQARISTEEQANHRFPEFFVGKEFTSDWTSFHFPTWKRIIDPRRDRITRVLEIGSFEGRSALFFLNYLPSSTLVCIDTFAGSEEHLDATSRHAADMAEVERRFDANLAPFGARCEKRKGRSLDVLPQLAFEQRKFDLMYVDGDHHAVSTYADAAAAWPMLVPGGIMIFDDYLWEQHLPPSDRPQLGIDSFLEAMAGRYRELHRGYQIIVEKF